MRVLLFSVTAGEGHNVTAKAIAHALEQTGAGTKIVDAYRTSGRFMYLLVAKGYALASSSLKYGYGIAYRLVEKRRGNSYKHSLIRLSGRTLAKKFKRVIDEYDPDVIVATHPFAARILDITKERHGFRAKTLAIVTDFTMHPYWEEALRLDRLIIPCEGIAPLAYDKGFTDAQIRPLGIPINAKFSATVEKQEARRILGLAPDTATLLLMGGAIGYGHMERALRRLDRLDPPFQIIVACGKNTRLYNRISSRAWQKSVLALGFTDNVPLLMDAADLIVSKPGGLTTSEALTRRLPLVIVEPIPGQEKHNAEFLTEIGCAVAVTKKYPLQTAVRDLLLDDCRRLAMRACADRICKPESTEDLVREICSLCASTPDVSE